MALTKIELEALKNKGRRGRKRLNHEAIVRAYLKDGATVASTAKECGCSTGTVTNALREAREGKL